MSLNITWGFRRRRDFKVVWNGGMLLAGPAHHTAPRQPDVPGLQLRVERQSADSDIIPLCQLQLRTSR